MSRYFLFFPLIVLFSISSCKNASEAEAPSPPNIIYILADDLGYGEVGYQGQEVIETPNIDALAASGLRFTQHYSGSAVCAPARCVLMTGQHTGHAYIRGNDEWGDRGDVWSFEAMFADPKLEGQRPLPGDTITLAERLQEQGYVTGAVGKWGLGAPYSEGAPNKQGFDFFYGYNCQRQAHTFYPTHLWRNDEREMLRNELIPPHHTPLPEGADPRDPTSYARYNQQDYSGDLIQQEALEFIENNKDQPFFLYYANTIPHVALQAPQRWVDYYHEKLGEEEPYTGRSYFPCRYPRATYAAMIATLDEQVGEVVAKLKELGIYENTLVIFTSDNGPTYAGGVEPEFFDSARPFVTDRNKIKGAFYEGGIRVPMVASWPGMIQPGETDHVSAFWDVLPTLCELSGAPAPAYTDGVSFAPTLLGKTGDQQKHDYLYWEIGERGGWQAVRFGKWKGIRRNIRQGSLDIELYDLEADIREENDLAGEHPEVVAQIAAIMAEAHVTPAIERFRMDALDQVER